MPRKLDFYGDLHSLALYHDSGQINQLLGIGDWHRQHDISIVARTKKDAIEHAAAMGIAFRAKDLYIRRGDSIKCMQESNLLIEGAIYVSYEGRGTLLRAVGPRQYEVVGRLERPTWRDPYTLERS